MALLSETFVTEDAEDAGFEPAPAGWYIAQIVKSAIKTTSAGTGEYIKNEWKILEADDPKYVGKLFWQNLNIVNPSEMAVKIGKGQLKKLNEAMGISELEDTDQLLGIPVKVFLKIKPGSGGYDDSNEVQKVKGLHEEDEFDGKESAGDEPWDS